MDFLQAETNFFKKQVPFAVVFAFQKDLVTCSMDFSKVHNIVYLISCGVAFQPISVSHTNLSLLFPTYCIDANMTPLHMYELLLLQPEISTIKVCTGYFLKTCYNDGLHLTHPELGQTLYTLNIEML